MFRYFIVYKPYKTLSQFTSTQGDKKTLADLFDVPKNVYPVGRLDEDSEGLLILTNDKKLKDTIDYSNVCITYLNFFNREVSAKVI